MTRVEQGDDRGEERVGAMGFGAGWWAVVASGGGMAGRGSADEGRGGMGRVNVCRVLGITEGGGGVN